MSELSIVLRRITESREALQYEAIESFDNSDYFDYEEDSPLLSQIQSELSLLQNALSEVEEAIEKAKPGYVSPEDKAEFERLTPDIPGIENKESEGE